MISLIKDNIIGVCNDLSPKLLDGWLNKTGQSDLYGPAGSLKYLPLQYSPQFLGDIILRAFQTLFNPFLANNLLIILCLLLSFYFSRKLFFHLKYSKYATNYLAIAYAFSPYFIYRVINVSQMLYFTFVFPLLLLLYLKHKSAWLLGGYIGFVFYLSTYYGYICLMSLALLLFSEFVMDLANPGRAVLISKFVKLLKVITISVLLVVLPNLKPFLHSTYIFGKYSKEELISSQTYGTIPLRSLEDFFAYSFRPWYFFLPPTDSIFLGDFSRKVYDRLEETNYFLTQGFDVSEDGGAFMGYVFIILSLILFYRIFRGYISAPQKKIYLSILLSLVMILSITGPPYFMISGHRFYTPTYLFYFVMPSFRVLVRFSAIIFLFVLIFAGEPLTRVEQLLTERKKQILIVPIFICFLLLTFFEFAVKMPIININRPPDYISYLQENTNGSVVAIYPNTNFEPKFWMPLKKIKLINPKFLDNPNFDEDKFTQELTTKEGIDKAREMGVSHIVIFIDEIEPLGHEKEVFNKNLLRLYQKNGVKIVAL